MRILIGVDGSPYSKAALEEVAKRSWPAGTEVLIVHAFELPMAPTPEAWALPPSYFEKLDNAVRTQSDAVVEAALQQLRAKVAATLKVEGRAILGSPRAVILDEAQEWKADLIVVGSHGYPTWQRLLLGSVSQAVVAHAKCSVEVVRLPAANQVAA
jgi:nucleotide-binding universal stress UspA family protein